jgi:UDP-N-acetylglucosamine--N-acetylmuramyl-(pentapeptide) pyrophosphoryl-undecaprenol N-acetylglucosamine transferase
MPKQSPKRTYLISGGGTGGHIFPALAIADEIKRRQPEAVIHFVGALGRMEMEKVPQHGYKITGLPISGLNRKHLLKNVSFPFKLLKSLAICRFLLKDKKASVVIGTGGFASGPLLWQAQRRGIPTLIQEQNSYPGITNKLLGKRAKSICVAYDKLEKYFPKQRIVKTGNPIRSSVLEPLPDQVAARKQFDLAPDKQTILILGGSLGARAINQAVAGQLSKLQSENNQLLWQCGKLYEEQYAGLTSDTVKVHAFIQDMNAAYAAADIIISRAGAGTLSELAVIGKPAILIPSPNVAEDHQTHNARAFATADAAILLPEHELEALTGIVHGLLEDTSRAATMAQSMKAKALPHATTHIVDEIEKLLS